MNKFTKYGWWVLIIIPLVLGFLIYLNQNDKTIQSTQNIIYTAEWAKEYFNSRVEELVGKEKYESAISNYADQYPKEFSGCEDYLLEERPNKRSNDIYNIRRLMEEKKYKEVITLSDKYLNDSEVWYCDYYFWTQRAQAFQNLNNCPDALTEAIHAFAIAPDDNENDESSRELYYSIDDSDVCKID
ncbi:hypothetical protein A2906_02950 [Candidatus Nomurabacteria bacterium RIFCSPLOWO2_01_FULL_37_25]|nr:MAG: hypothetical protein A2640_01605 [Candidatus Nomurabacteria bacterium RIFCSPHIGHO2_01_FULL_36_23]OGI88013.1 MAG: hypothetical protein A2906_02950 [Candidatus Nomurabacteria bacterium RIFCSPLOWO2_01_FULL_37_25]